MRSAELLANPGTGPPATLVDKSDTHWEDLFGTGSSSGANSTGAGSYWSRILAAARSNRLGHQGLMAERMDWVTSGGAGGGGSAAITGSWSDPMGSETTEPWDPSNPPPVTEVLGGRVLEGHEVLYHSRGRMYAPTLGRFTSADPNATGVPVLSSLAFGGMPLSAGDVTPDWLSHYGDGMNVHAAYGGNPLATRDPLGLCTNWSNYSSAYDGRAGWDPFDMVDEYIMEDLGSKAAFIHRAIGASHAAAYLATYIGSYAPGPIGIGLGIANGVIGRPDILDGTQVAGAIDFVEGGMQFLSDAVNPLRMLSGIRSAYALSTQGYVDRGLGGIGTGFGAVGLNIADFGSGGAANYTDYLGYENGKPTYVGITTQSLDARQYQHGVANIQRNFDRLNPIASNLTERQARAIETLIIDSNPHFSNRIRSISGKATFFDTAMRWAAVFTGRRGIPVRY